MVETVQKFLTTGKSQSKIARELGVSRQYAHQCVNKNKPLKAGSLCRGCKTVLTKDNRSASVGTTHTLCKTCLNTMQIKNKYRTLTTKELERLKNKWVRLLKIAEEVLSERVNKP